MCQENCIQFGLVWFGLVWFGLVWFGLVWFGLVWFWLGLVNLLRCGWVSPPFCGVWVAQCYDRGVDTTSIKVGQCSTNPCHAGMMDDIFKCSFHSCCLNACSRRTRFSLGLGGRALGPGCCFSTKPGQGVMIFGWFHFCVVSDPTPIIILPMTFTNRWLQTSTHRSSHTHGHHHTTTH